MKFENCDADLSSSAGTGRFTADLRQRLAEPLPGRAAQARFESELAYGRHFGPPRFDARPAAVLVLLHHHDGRWFVPLTVRPEHLPVHAGQISLPGGLLKPGESYEQAAVRELQEEMGVAAGDVELLGRLSPLYIFGTNFYVVPCVAAIEPRPEYRPDIAEVAELLEIPLVELLDRSNWGRHMRATRGVRHEVPHIAWRGHNIWGATAMILGEFLAVCEEVLPKTEVTAI